MKPGQTQRTMGPTSGWRTPHQEMPGVKRRKVGTAMEVRRLSEPLGAEIIGVDLRQEVDTATFASILEAFQRHHLILVRSQVLTEDQQAAFSMRLGPLSHQGDNMSHGGKVMFISNTREDGALPNGELLFHSDHCFFEHPLKALSLYALEVPTSGGETVFLNAQKAYDALPKVLKERIDGAYAEHGFDYGYKSGNQRVRSEDLPETAKRATHPVAWPHPESGRKILFVNQLMTYGIIGLDPVEGDALLDELFAHLARPEFQYKHKWQVHDYVIWDNRVLQHARTNFDPTEKRTLRRVPIGETAHLAVSS